MDDDDEEEKKEGEENYFHQVSRSTLTTFNEQDQFLDYSFQGLERFKEQNVYSP